MQDYDCRLKIFYMFLVGLALSLASRATFMAWVCGIGVAFTWLADWAERKERAKRYKQEVKE